MRTHNLDLILKLVDFQNTTNNQSSVLLICAFYFAGPYYRHTLGNHLVGYRDHPMHSTRRPNTDLTSSSSSSSSSVSSWKEALLIPPWKTPSSPSLISDRPVKRKGEVIDDGDGDSNGNGNSVGGGNDDVNGFQETYTFFKQVAVGKPGRKRFSRGGGGKLSSVRMS